MSNTLAIATVSATLQQLLLAGVSTDFPGATVTLGEPKAPSASPSPQVNICMYQISPNMGYRNYDMPAKDSAGNWVNQPKLGIDLHYLLTFYGNEQQLEPQRLLGDVLSTLHTQPILTRDLIEATINQPLYSFLANSDLANETVEQVKLIPQANPREEIARLWRDYFQTIPYSLSLAYQASVVLIEATKVLKPQVPVDKIIINASPGTNLASPMAAAGLTLNLTKASENSVSGSITVIKAPNEKNITQYDLYWSSDGQTKLSLIATKNKTGSNIVLSLSTPIARPAGANYVLVLTRNATIEMTYGVSAALAPIHKASAIQLDFIKAGGNNLSGSITISKADNENDVTLYNLYWGNGTNSKLSNTPFISLPKTGHDLVSQLSPPIPRPAGAIYVLGFTENSLAEMTENTPIGIPPLNKALALTLAVSKSVENKLTGTITVTKALDESDITSYLLYWGVDGNTKLANTGAFKALPKTGSDLTYQLTAADNLIVPAGASYIIVITGNDQAEMSYGAGSLLP